VPTRTGYTFGGYYSSTGGSGTQYYNASGVSVRSYDKTSDITLYAKWTPNQYKITLDNQGATTAGSTSVMANYNSVIPSITLPQKTGYTFYGYYTGTNGTGTKYYSETGSSSITWKSTSGLTLYAYWIENSITITCSNYTTEESTYLKTTCIDGKANVTGKTKYCLDYAKTNYSSITANSTCVTSCQNKYSSKCSGCTGDSCSACGSHYANLCQTYCKQEVAYANCKSDQQTYTVTLNNQSATSAGTLITEGSYGLALPDITVPTRTGYTFGGYYSSTGGSGTQYYNASGVSVRSYDKTSDITLYAKWTPNQYKITLDNQGATTAGSTSVTATYNSVIPSITLPTKSGYKFFGYYTATDGSGTKYYDFQGERLITWNLTSNLTLYAYWVSDNNTVTCSGYDESASIGWANISCSNNSASVNAVSKYCLDYAKTNYSSATTNSTCITSCQNKYSYACSGCSGSGCSACGSHYANLCQTYCKKENVYSACISSFQ